MERSEATYQYLEEAHGNGMFFYTSCCGNRMYSVGNNPMKYHGCLCPKCFWQGKSTTLYLRGTEDGIRVLKNEHFIRQKARERYERTMDSRSRETCKRLGRKNLSADFRGS